MICLNSLSEEKSIALSDAKIFTQLLSPFAPHIAEEIWEHLGEKGSILNSSWPEADPRYLSVDRIHFAVQVNGKLRATIEASPDAHQEEIQKMALEDQRVSKFITGEIKKVIFVPKKLISFVVKG